MFCCCSWAAAQDIVLSREIKNMSKIKDAVIEAGKWALQAKFRIAFWAISMAISAFIGARLG
jgi:hypothetical protein